MKTTTSSILQKIFEDFDFNDLAEVKVRGANHDQPVNIIEFPCVHRDDQEPVNLIAPALNHGPWIAGGAALRWYQDQAVGDNDIDVFCADSTQAQNIINHIKSYGRWSSKFQSDNATTLSYWNQQNTKTWTIQIITRRYFPSLQAVIDNFDITVCQIGTAGNHWVMGDRTARDIRERNLCMLMPLQPDAAKRMVKYWTYGYRPVDDLLDQVCASPVAKQHYTSDEDYQNAF